MKRPLAAIARNVVAIVVALIVVIPLLVVIVNSLKTQGEADSMTLTLPRIAQWANYGVVIDEGKLVQSFLNSVFFALFSTALSLVASSMAAFVLSRHGTRVNRTIYYFIVAGIALPTNYVSLMKVMQVSHLVNSRVGLGVLLAALQIPFSLFLFYGFVSTIPRELDDAAVIDGAGPLRLFFGVITPLLVPVIMTVLILNFMGAWNEFVLPLYYLNSASKWPMTLAVYNFFGQYESSWNLVSADIVLTTLPVIVVYLIGQRYIVAGLTAGSVKA